MKYTYESRKLNFQLVPRSCWYVNLRSVLPNWSEISNKVRKPCICSICGVKKPITELHAHEVWSYDDVTHEQHLADLICVCEDCHNAIHIGHANIEGKGAIALQYYMKINGLTKEQADRDYREAFIVWGERSTHKWSISESEIYAKVKELTGIDCDINKPINGRYYAKVPYDQKDQAKTFGARWDSDRKMWYFMSEEARKNWYECEDH
jgi:hypothetical protein